MIKMGQRKYLVSLEDRKKKNRISGHFGVMSIPLSFFIKDGKEVDRIAPKPPGTTLEIKLKNT